MSRTVPLVLAALIALGPGCGRSSGPGARKPDVAKDIVIGAGVVLLVGGIAGLMLMREIGPTIGGPGYVDFADPCRDGCR